MIEIIVNGERKNVPHGLNVKEVVEALEYRGKGYGLAVNGTFVAIATYEKTIINDNDSLEILAPVQGG
ncbi:MAG: sulfur carrier protein ThiS [Campylobacterota bacterium]|nr:sulfur carrier protein ThiS [Campylobacterota bacterium]